MSRKTKQNAITSPEKTSRINAQNLRLMRDFLSYLKSTQRAQSTIEVYENDLLIFFTYDLEHLGNKFFCDVKKRDIVAFQGWLLEENQNSPSRIRRIKATLSSLSNYICNVLDDEYPDFKNIIHKIESPVAQPVREKTVLKDEQIDELLKVLVDNKEYAKACMLALAMCSGRRKSELVRFKTHYFDDANIIFGSLYKTPETVKTKGRGNGKFIHCYTLVKEFKPYLNLWLEERKRLGIESEWLFPLQSDPAQPMKPDTLNSWAITFSRILNIDFYWHSLRHFFVTHLVRSGLPDSVVQNIVGWTSADMVRVYTDIHVEEQLGKYFDENGIKQVSATSISDL